ncbi:hypothetical protein H6G64_34190 [Calothrix sp. FACHB-156]|nr:hypothetical protein [Calothrix sp. FACHB-156]
MNMQKPLAVQKEGNCQKALSGAYSSSSTAKNQTLPTQDPKNTNLVGKIRDNRLTESLEILAGSQIEGDDLPLFIVANLQQMEVAR